MTTAQDSTPRIGILGAGPPIEAATSALSDIDVETTHIEPTELATVDAAVASAPSGGGSLKRVNRHATTAGIPWVGIEIGGIGGQPTDYPGTVGAFTSDGPCYTCLQRRVAGNITEENSEASTTRSESRFAGAVAGRLLIRWLSGADRAGRIVSLPATYHTLLPTLNCPNCGTDRETTVTLAHSESSIDTVADRAEQAVDDTLGPVMAVGERDSYPAPYYLARMGATEAISDADAMEQAAGVANEWDVAYVKAVGEALERYCAGVYRTDSFLTAPTRALDAAVSPSSFVLDAEVEIPDDDEELQWIQATDLGADSIVYVPAERTVFPPPSRRLGSPITTGLGLGSSTVEAVRSGLSEVIERDATMLAWYSTYEPVGLSVTDETVEALTRRAQSENLSVTLTLLTQDIDVPVVGATVTREDWPRFAAGSAANVDPISAARNALCEALQNWMELRALGRERADEAGKAVAKYADDPRGVRELTSVDPVLDVGDVGPEPRPTGQDAVTYLLEAIADADLSAYAARLTTRDVAHLGFEAVRVLVPRAQPLFIDSACFGDRATVVPPRLGYEPQLDRSFHPFP